MKKTLKILIVSLIILGCISVGIYAYFEPQTVPGHLFLKSKFYLRTKDHSNISSHLQSTNGGYIPPKFEEFIFSELAKSKNDSTEQKNLLGFLAHQSKNSRAGSKIFTQGEKYLPLIIQYGKQAETRDEQLGYLYLAYGIAKSDPAYKPTFESPLPMEKLFDHIENGDLNLVGIREL